MKKNLIVKPIKTYHSVKSLGYMLFEKRNKLKNIYQNCDKKELSELRKKYGTDYINDEILFPIIIYTGDTTSEVFNNELFTLYTFPYIITECTFIDDLENADLSERANNYSWIIKMNKTTFILTHFSTRYKLTDIINFFSKDMPKNIRHIIYSFNVVPKIQSYIKLILA